MICAVAKAMPVGVGVVGVEPFQFLDLVHIPEIVCVSYFILIHYTLLHYDIELPTKHS